MKSDSIWNRWLPVAMRSLTPRQSAALMSAHARWLGWISSSKPANRAQAEEGVRFTYRAGGVPEPRIFLWFDDLPEALLATEQLSDYRESNWMLPAEALRRRMDVRKRIRHRLALRTWKQVVQAVGARHTPGRHEQVAQNGIQWLAAVPREDSLQAGLPAAIDDPATDWGVVEDLAAAIESAGSAYYAEMRGSAERTSGPGILGHAGIGYVPTIYDSYRLGQLFRHDCLSRVCGERGSARYTGLRLTAEHCLAWWAFANAAILCDRPQIVQRDESGRLHCDKGPAVVFRNGVELFAWHGAWIPQEAVLQPESLTAPAIRLEGDAKVRAALIEIYGSKRYERERRPRAPRKLRNPLEIVLPADPGAKIEVLKSYGPLPFYERYLAGECRQVWGELEDLGAEVRASHYSADALAVAYVTMKRVRQNIVQLIGRLREIGFEFEVESTRRDIVIPFGAARMNLWTNAPPDQPAPLRLPDLSRADFRRLERDAGELPISLRAWYEVVGSVALGGKHPILSPEDWAVLPHALEIVPFARILLDWDNSAPDVGIGANPFAAVVTPDVRPDEHRLGKPYAITLPSAGADALLENEPHGFSFIGFLRNALNWGGFPGFECSARVPKEVEFLRDGLLPF